MQVTTQAYPRRKAPSDCITLVERHHFHFHCHGGSTFRVQYYLMSVGTAKLGLLLRPSEGRAAASSAGSNKPCRDSRACDPRPSPCSDSLRPCRSDDLDRLAASACARPNARRWCTRRFGGGTITFFCTNWSSCSAGRS